MKRFFVMNPGSRGGKSQKKIALIHQLLEKKGINYQYQLTQKLSDAYQLAQTAATQNYQQIIAVGGDGTINQVLNGLYDQQGKRLSNAKMGVIYTGTSPDFCKSYNIPLNLEEAIDLIDLNQSASISVGQINFKAQTRYFACCANIGLGASLAKAANSGIRKRLGDKLGTFCALLNILVKYKNRSSHFTIDQKHRQIDSLLNLAVGRTRYIASGIQLAHKLSDNDEQFYLLTVAGVRPWQWPKLLYTIYNGKSFTNRPYLRLEYAHEVIVNNDLDIEFDGDPAGIGPVSIKMATDKLDLIRWTQKKI